MKKFVSLVLAVVMVVGMSAAGFAAPATKITGVTMAIDTNNTFDFTEIEAGSTKIIDFPLTADMFTWSNAVIASKDAVTKEQISASRVAPVIVGSVGTKAISKVSIVYERAVVTGNVITATVRVELIDKLQDTSDLKFNLNLFLNVNGSRQQDSRLRLDGKITPKVVTVTTGDDYKDISRGEVLEANAFIRNFNAYIGSGVSVVANLYSNTRYYGTASNSPKKEDDAVLGKYDSINDILYLETVNLSKNSTVLFESYAGYHVYNSSGNYLGVGSTSKGLPYSTKYYLSTKNLGSKIDVGNGGSGGGNSSSSESSSSSETTTPPATSGIINSVTATTDAQAAIKKANTSGSKTAIITYKNVGGIAANALQAINATGNVSKKTMQINADTTYGNTVTGRITINPALASKLVSDTNFGVYTDDRSTNVVSTYFNKWFKNNMKFIALDQKDTFGMNVNIAAKVDLTGMNVKNLRLYTFNAAKNQYTEIKNANVWVDGNGYLRFTTYNAGAIVISDGPLLKR